MEEPKAKQNAPYKVTLAPKTYLWCTCGLSDKDPLCDGKHKGTEFMHQKFEITEEKDYWLCGCKKTKNPPFCDGTHKSL